MTTQVKPGKRSKETVQPPTSNTKTKKGAKKNTVEAKEEPAFKLFSKLYAAALNDQSKIDYDYRQCFQLIAQVINLFKNDTMLAPIDAPCMVVGDLNGNLLNLIRILNLGTEKSSESQLKTHRTVFLGNYLNLFGHSAPILFFLFSLKALFPDQYILLRGSYEYSISNNNRLKAEMIEKFGKLRGNIIFQFLEEAIFHMPLSALISKRILCVHSGISPHLSSRGSLSRLPLRIPEITKVSLATDLVWANPIDFGVIHPIVDKPIFSHNGQGLSYNFNETAVAHCLKKLEIDLIVRGHESYERGFRFYADHRMVTIFSTPEFRDQKNDAAILRVHEDGGISIDTFGSKANNQMNAENNEDQPSSTMSVSRKLDNIGMINSSASSTSVTKKLEKVPPHV